MANIVYDRVISLIKEQKLTKAKVEKAAGLGNGTIESWKNGSPILEKLEAVANVLGITLVELLKEPSEEAEELTLKKVCEIYLCLGVEKNKEIEEAKKNVIDNPKKIGSEILLYQKMIEFENWMNKYKAIERNIAEMREQMMLHPEWF